MEPTHAQDLAPTVQFINFAFSSHPRSVDDNRHPLARINNPFLSPKTSKHGHLAGILEHFDNVATNRRLKVCGRVNRAANHIQLFERRSRRVEAIDRGDDSGTVGSRFVRHRRNAAPKTVPGAAHAGTLSIDATAFPVIVAAELAGRLRKVLVSNFENSTAFDAVSTRPTRDKVIENRFSRSLRAGSFFRQFCLPILRRPLIALEQIDAQSARARTL